MRLHRLLADAETPGDLAIAASGDNEVDDLLFARGQLWPLGAALGGERFLTEIRTTARLQHPHILPLLDSGDADGLLYYVMPLVTGETLRARLDGPWNQPEDDSEAEGRSGF